MGSELSAPEADPQTTFEEMIRELPPTGFQTNFADSTCRIQTLSVETFPLRCKVLCGSMVNMLMGIRNDLVYAARSLSKARAFTAVCIVSLGIGMAPVIAVPYLARIPRMPPPGVNTEGLVEVFTTTVGPRLETNSWSYQDFTDLRNSNTGIALIGWATAPGEVTLPGGRKMALWPMYVSRDYFETIGAGQGSRWMQRYGPRSASSSTTV